MASMDFFGRYKSSSWTSLKIRTSKVLKKRTQKPHHLGRGSSVRRSPGRRRRSWKGLSSRKAMRRGGTTSAERGQNDASLQAQRPIREFASRDQSFRVLEREVPGRREHVLGGQ